jgi:hypothetical protein
VKENATLYWRMYYHKLHTGAFVHLFKSKNPHLCAADENCLLETPKKRNHIERNLLSVVAQLELEV